ncbi:MAG: rRNA maturation RNAse YbeY [Patescibacteria group bacterium]
MIHVKVSKQGNYAINTKKIKDTVRSVFVENGVDSPPIVSVALVGTETIKVLVDKYYDDHEKHLVLTFASDGKDYFGDIIVSYPDCVLEAKERNKLIEEVVLEYAKHGALHLIGIHHD